MPGREIEREGDGGAQQAHAAAARAQPLFHWTFVSCQY
jgi:hypothetical protein